MKRNITIVLMMPSLQQLTSQLKTKPYCKYLGPVIQLGQRPSWCKGRNLGLVRYTSCSIFWF